MDNKYIAKIIAFVKETDLTEFAWEKREDKIYFRRQPRQPKSAAAGRSRGVPLAADGGAGAEDEAKVKYVPVRSTMVGTFYRSASPDRPPFVVEGSAVVPGQKVGVIEAMKVMKDVVSHVEGRIVRIQVTSGHPVEYGQELFLVEPEGA